MNNEEFIKRLRLCMKTKRQSNGRPSTGYSIDKDGVVSSSTIENLLKGKMSPSIDTLISLSEYFEVSIDWLVTGKEPERPTLDCTPVEVPRHIYDLIASEVNKVGAIRRGIEEIVSILHKEHQYDNTGTIHMDMIS